MAITTGEFDFIRGFVADYSAIHLNDGKEYLVEMRLEAVMRALGIDTFGELISQLKTGAMDTVRGMVIEAMTTNETSFYRDVQPFEALKTQVLPDLIKARSADRKLNIWCAASSTGQEPYSICMLIRENFPELINWKIEILATDLSKKVLVQAREGVFSQIEVNRGLPAPLLVKYFRPKGNDWEISEEIRKMVDFRHMNLNSSWLSMPPLDIVFIRNVLIYFSVENKKKILKKIGQGLLPNRYLFLGAAETTLNLDDSFERVPVGKTVCYRLK